MLQVLSAVTGESIAEFQEVDFEEGSVCSVKALKERLAQKVGISRFRLRLLQDDCILDDDQILIDDQQFTLQVVQLVSLEFQLPDEELDREELDREMMEACERSDEKVLEWHLNRPRNPDFEEEDFEPEYALTPLCAASLSGSLECVSLLIEAGANKDLGTTEDGTTPLFLAARGGHLEVVRFNFKVPLMSSWLSLVPTKTKAGQIQEQRLFSLRLIRGTLKLSDFWWSPVPTKTKAGQMTEQRLFS